MANGVVIDRGTNDNATEWSIASAWASHQELAIDAQLPRVMPSNKASQCRASNARCCQIGTANATVTGPSTSSSQWVLRAYSA